MLWESLRGLLIFYLKHFIGARETYYNSFVFVEITYEGRGKNCYLNQFFLNPS